MNRIFNGIINWSFFRDLKRMIKEYWEYHDTWIKELEKDGNVTVKEGFSLFRMGTYTTFETPKEIEDFLEELLNEKLNELQKRWKPGIFERQVIDFIRKNAWKYPSPSELIDIAAEAEAERIQIEGMTLPINSATLAMEILRLSSEIMERARDYPLEDYPDERVFTPEDPYPEEFTFDISTEHCDHCYVEHDVLGSDAGDAEYRVKFYLNKLEMRMLQIMFEWGTRNMLLMFTWKPLAEERELSEEEHWLILLTIYKGVLERAKDYKVDFINEIDFTA